MKELLPIGYFYETEIPIKRIGLTGKVNHGVQVVAYMRMPNGEGREILEVHEIMEPTEEKSLTIYDPNLQTIHILARHSN